MHTIADINELVSYFLLTGLTAVQPPALPNSTNHIKLDVTCFSPCSKMLAEQEQKKTNKTYRNKRLTDSIL